MTIRILLADDSLTFLAAVRQFLATLPQAQVVGEAHDGHEALAKADELRPDLVLLDIAMPGVNGLNVARTMQSWPVAPRIVFLSMNDSLIYRTAALDLAPSGFVGKADFVVELPAVIARLAAEAASQEV